MKLLVALVLCTLGAVNSRIPELRWLEEKMPEYMIKESVFRGQREYQFVYNGQLLTGIPSSSKQHSGKRIQALVSLIFRSPESAILRFNHVRMGKLNRPIPNPRVILPFMVFENAPISEELRQQLMAPVRFSYVDGLISNIVFDGIEQPWSANIKRGVLNLLQVNLKRQNVVRASEEALALNEPASPLDPTRDSYRVMENTLEGECETLYTVVNEPHPYYTSGPVLNVSKTINFESCVKRPHIKYNFRFSDPCPSCDRKYNSDERFLKSSTVFNYNISGTPDSFIIERAKVESHYVVVPFNEEGNVIITYVNQTLVLVRSGPVETEVSEPTSPIPSDSQMIYSPDWDVIKEKFFMEGDEEFHSKTPYPDIRNNVQFVTSILRKLISNIREQVEDPAPRYFDNLVIFFRILKRQELEKIWKKFFVQVPSDFTPEQHKKIKSLIVDAIAFAGTKENVYFLVHKIKSRQIPPIMASLAIKSFINIRVVSKEMINELLSLAESEVCRRVFFLRQSVYLTLGSMINALCTPNEDLLALEFKVVNPQLYCPRELKLRWVELLFQKFRSSASWEEKVLYMKSISNAGLDLSIFELEKIIKNLEETRYPTFLRVEAVLALRQIKDFMPRKVQKILMPVFMNRYEPPELRIVSAYQIFQTLPERPVLDQMAKRIFMEPSRQVTSFVFTYMHTMSNSTNPCEKRLAEDMKLALRHSRFAPFSFFMGYSKMIHKSFFSRKYNFGMDVDFASSFSNSSYFPRHLAWTVNPIFGGFWAKYFTTFGFVSEGFERIFWRYFGARGFYYEKPLEEILRRTARSVRTRNPSEELKEMFSSLRIRPREYFPNSPKAYFYLKFKDQEFGFLPFSLDSLPDEVSRLFQQGQINFRQIEQILEEGYNFYFYKGILLHELSYKIPTSLGFPLRYRASVPTVMSLTGQLKAQLTPNRKLHNIKLIFRELKPSFVSSWISNIESWSPVVNTGLKVLVKAKFFYPFTGKMELDLKKSPMEFKLSIMPPRRPVQVFSLETRPISYAFLWPQQLNVWQHPEEVTIMGEDWTRVNNFSYSFGEYLLGINMRVAGYWHRTPAMKQVDTPFCPLSGPNRLVVYTEPGYEMPKEIIVKFSGNLYQPLTEELKPEFSEFELFSQPYEEFTPEMLQSLKQFAPVESKQHMIKMEVLAKGGSVPRRFQMENYLQCCRVYRYCKFMTRLERTPVPRMEEGNQPFKFCLDGESLFPSIPHSFSELASKKAIAQFKMAWGPSCSSEKFVRLNVIGGRSSRQVELERMSPEYRFFSEPSEDMTINSPVFQYEHLYKYAHLLEYHYDLEYSRVPVVVQNLTNFVYRLLKHRYFWQTQVAQIHVRNPENKVRGFLSLDPWSKMYFNLTVKAPLENTTFLDIPIRLPLTVSPFNIRHSRPILSVLDDVIPMTPFVSRPVCHVSSRYVKTFDTVKYTVPFSSCWTVLVKDCGNAEQPTFGVYLQKLNEESELKKIKIVTRSHRFVLVPQSEEYESVKIEVNGQLMAPEEFEPILNHGHVVARVERIGKYVVMYLPETGISVYFDGYSANIKISELYRNLVCGLCGHYDYEPLDEFRLPTNELVDDVREFYHSYIIPDESCSVPEVSEICQTSSCEPTPMTPMYCPVCKYVVREGYRESELTKPELKNMILRYCDQYPSLAVSCKRFFQPLISKIFLQVKEGKSEEEICSLIRACSPELFSVYESESFPYYPKPEFQSFEPAFPVLRTKVLEQDHQLCFSKIPVPVCPHHAYAQTYKPEKRVVYSCLSRDDPQAEVFFRRLVGKFIVLQEVSEFPASFTETELFPETCSPLYY